MARYEYQTRFVEGSRIEVLSTTFDETVRKIGWVRVWADVTTEGAFIVYRREIREKAS
jgi:hypothetical protein